MQHNRKHQAEQNRSCQRKIENSVLSPINKIARKPPQRKVGPSKQSQHQPEDDDRGADEQQQSAQICHSKSLPRDLYTEIGFQSLRVLEFAPMRRCLIFPVLFVALVASAQQTSEVEITAEPRHHLAIENEYVRVFQVNVAPHDATLMHVHHHDYVYITLGAADLSNEVKGKPPLAVKLQDGETRFVPGNFAHIARNLADTPFRNVTVEFLQDEAAHKTPPPKWDEERGLHVFTGGTQDVIFVQDGVRASEVDLQPGATLPSHHHAGPHLVVAITDLEIRSDVEGKGPMPGHLKSGDVKWLPGDYTHTLTNVGKQEAKFITLEFH